MSKDVISQEFVDFHSGLLKVEVEIRDEGAWITARCTQGARLTHVHPKIPELYSQRCLVGCWKMEMRRLV